MSNKLSRKAKFLLLVSIILIVLSTNLFPWSILSGTIFSKIQFPWRLLILVSFSCSLLFSTIMHEMDRLSNSEICLLTILILVITLSFNANVIRLAKQDRYTPITNKNFDKEQHAEIGHGREYLIKGTNYDLYMSYENKIVIVDGKTLLNESNQIKKTDTGTTIYTEALPLKSNGSIVSSPLFY